MKLTLVPSGEFMMGSGESAEDTAAFFNKNYGEDLSEGRSLQGRAPAAPGANYQAVLSARTMSRGASSASSSRTAGYKTDAEKGDKPGRGGWNTEKKEFGFNKGYSWRNAGFEQTDEHPVVNVSWNDAVAFCQWLSGKEGKTYRLPTEAEWEYACRAGTKTRYYSGDDPETLAKVANVADATAKAKFPDWKWTIKASDGYVFTAPVGQFKPNAFGLYDMHGNAWQWCADWYGADYYGKSPADDPKGPDTGRGIFVSFGAVPGTARPRCPFRRSHVGHAEPRGQRRWLPRCQDSVATRGLSSLLRMETELQAILAWFNLPAAG